MSIKVKVLSIEPMFLSCGPCLRVVMTESEEPIEVGQEYVLEAVNPDDVGVEPGAVIIDSSPVSGGVDAASEGSQGEGGNRAE